MAAFVRAATLMHFGKVAGQVGLNPRFLLREAGLDLRVLTEPDMRVQADKVATVLERAAERSGIASFGLRMAELRQLSDFGALGLLISHQPTLRAVLATMAQYRDLMNEALALHVEESGGLVILREELSIDGAAPLRQAHELAVGTLSRTLRALLGRNWLPLGVHFAHSAPLDSGIHRRLFGPKLVFNSDFNGVVCTAQDLDRLNPKADPGLARYARQFIDTLPHAGRQSTTQDVRKAVYLLLPLGRASLSGVGEYLGSNNRRLQRQLAAEGSEFQALLAGVRRDLAVRYMCGTRHSLTEVTEILGYNRLSSFTRWFAGEFGIAPSRWRKLPGRTRSSHRKA
jgi:AraC-like DNA-binding protein